MRRPRPIALALAAATAALLAPPLARDACA
jgi:hypothetical protein